MKTVMNSSTNKGNFPKQEANCQAHESQLDSAKNLATSDNCHNCEEPSASEIGQTTTPEPPIQQAGNTHAVQRVAIVMNYGKRYSEPARKCGNIRRAALPVLLADMHFTIGRRRVFAVTCDGTVVDEVAKRPSDQPETLANCLQIAYKQQPNTRRQKKST